jgi:serine/threonine protein kinase
MPLLESDVYSDLETVYKEFSIENVQFLAKGGEKSVYTCKIDNQEFVLYHKKLSLDMIDDIVIMQNMNIDCMPKTKKIIRYKDNDDILYLFIDQKYYPYQYRDSDVKKFLLCIFKLQVLGYIHGDITPNNIMQTEKGEPVFIDFNYAKMKQENNLIASTFYSYHCFNGCTKDVVSLGRTLLCIKYINIFKQHSKNMLDEIINSPDYDFIENVILSGEVKEIIKYKSKYREFFNDDKYFSFHIYEKLINNYLLIKIILKEADKNNWNKKEMSTTFIQIGDIWDQVDRLVRKNNMNIQEILQYLYDTDIVNFRYKFLIDLAIGGYKNAEDALQFMETNIIFP